jgi:hypothetical protein
MRIVLLIAAPLWLMACSKHTARESYEGATTSNNVTAASREIDVLAQGKPTKPIVATAYTIQQGAHECDQSTLKSVSGTVMNFVAKFDESASYPAVITDYNHAYDVNKLYGFSEGLNNQYNSARIGWRWLNNELQLFAYVYVKGTLQRDPFSYDPPFIKSVAIGTDIQCSIAISGDRYIFTVDGVQVQTQRGTTSTKYSGYQQYPYFGGTLTAPHLITIGIK